MTYIKVMDGLLYVLKFFIVCYAGFVVFLYFSQRTLLYYPLKTPPQLDDLKGVYTEVKTQTKEGFSLTHWYSKQGLPYIVVFHGNAGNIESRGYGFQFLVDQGYSVLVASYRGYGGNAGKPTEKSIIEDSLLVLEWLLKEEKISSKEVILFGESLGSAVALAVAEKHPVKALIFDGAFSSVKDIAQSLYFYLPVSLLLKDSWDSQKRIRKVKAPTFFIHATEDKTVPLPFGKKLFAFANEPKQFLGLDNSNHNSNLEKTEVQKAIVEFIDRLKQ